MKIQVTALLSVLFLSSPARGQAKPTVLIHGEGNISTTSAGIGSAGVVGSGTVIGSSSHKSTVNKHDQTMEMAQDFLRFCPSVDLTLNAGAPADYVVRLNREGSATIFGELGRSQIMVINGLDSPIFVSKKATVENAVKSACNAIAADWQAHGRLKKRMPVAVPSPAASPAPVASVATPLPSWEPGATPTPKPADIAVVMMTTAAAEKRSKPETLASVLSDTTAYLTSKGMKLGSVGTSRSVLVLVVDRPLSKWLKITVQEKDSAGNVLWSEAVSDGGWGHLGAKGTLDVLEKVHKVIDTHLPPVTAPSQP